MNGNLPGCHEPKVEEAGMMDARPAILKRPAPAEQRMSADEAMRKAERFPNRHLGHSLAAGTPQPVPFPLRSTWVVPVQLIHPTQSGDATRPAPTTAGPRRERDC
jgi:hypothetical protein